MSRKITQIFWSWYNSGISRTEIRAHIECDGPVDLPPNVDAIDGYRLTIGCTAHTINGDNSYMMASNGTWYVLRDDSTYYTIAQVNALLAQKQDLLTWDTEPASGSDNAISSGAVFSALAALLSGIMGPGTRIQGTADTPFYIDDLKTSGAYYIGSYQDLANIRNYPNDTDIGNVRANLYVFEFFGTNRSFQIYVPNRTSNAQAFAELYIRSYGSSWQAWRGIYGTQI